MMDKRKLTKGRQKIEMKPIRDEVARQVSFSKRRPSIFKKASEISTLCGAEVVVVIFSPGDKSFSFGHPSVYSLVDRFLAMHCTHGYAVENASHGADGMTGTKIHEMHQQLADLQQSMEVEKQRKANVQQALKKESGGCVMQRLVADVGMLGLDELKEFKKELTAIQSMVNGKVCQMQQDAKQTRGPPPQPQAHVSLDSQIVSGLERGRPMNTILPSSTNGPFEGLDANTMLDHSRVGHGSCFNGSFCA